jgi:hypothetical protein
MSTHAKNVKKMVEAILKLKQTVKENENCSRNIAKSGNKR